MDISDIEPGLDFVETIEKELTRCEVLLVVIGNSWTSCVDEQGQRRLDDPNDFIRLETATCLRRNIRVIPVLVGEAQMPSQCSTCWGQPSAMDATVPFSVSSNSTT